MAADDTVEFRVGMPKDLVVVLDAVAMHEGTSRTAVINELVRKMAEDRLGLAKMLYRLTRDHPMWGER